MRTRRTMLDGGFIRCLILFSSAPSHLQNSAAVIKDMRELKSSSLVLRQVSAFCGVPLLARIASHTRCIDASYYYVARSVCLLVTTVSTEKRLNRLGYHFGHTRLPVVQGTMY